MSFLCPWSFVFVDDFIEASSHSQCSSSKCSLRYSFYEFSRFVSGHSVCWRFAVSDVPASNHAFNRGRQLVSFQFDNLYFLCQSIKIKSNKHIYRQSQVRKPVDSEVKWAECSFIIGTGCWAQLLWRILDNSPGLWVDIQSAGDLVSQTSQLRILRSAEENHLSPFDSKFKCLCQGIKINNNKHHVRYHHSSNYL